MVTRPRHSSGWRDLFVPMTCPPLLRLLAPASLVLLTILPAVAAPKTRKGADASQAQAPVLVSTEGKASGWSTVEDLAAAAEKGDASAKFEYARLLEHGDQVKADPTRALKLYQDAAEAGQKDALFRLGKIHHDGLLNQPVNYPTAVDYYLRAAAAGVPEAMYNLGAMLVSARGVKRDYVAGLAWLTVAQQRGADATAGLEQVRQRLSRRPEQIAAAERRAIELAETLNRREIPTLEGTPRQPKPAAPLTPPAGPAGKPKADVRLTPDAEDSKSLRPRPVSLPPPSLTLPPPTAAPAPAANGQK